MQIQHFDIDKCKVIKKKNLIELSLLGEKKAMNHVRFKTKPSIEKKKKNYINLLRFEREKKRQKGLGLTVLNGLQAAAYSRALSRYCSTWGLLPAAFPPWAGTSLLRRPGCPFFRSDNHIDAELSVGARSPQNDDKQNSHSQAIHQPRPPKQLDYRRTPQRPVELWMRKQPI